MCRGLTSAQIGLTCENSRRVVHEPAVAEPAVVPVPLTIVPVQAQDEAVAVRAPKDSSIEVDERRIAVRLLLPAGRNQMLVLPESLEDPGIEADVASVLETRQLVLALDPHLT